MASTCYLSVMGVDDNYYFLVVHVVVAYVSLTSLHCENFQMPLNQYYATKLDKGLTAQT